MFHVLGAIAEFERSLIIDRVRAGMKRAKASGTRIGRPRVPVDRGRVAMLKHGGKSLRQIARELGVSAMSVSRALSADKVTA
jgi:DNA invertase Pin-like site-specific DNA recombinase